MAAVDESAGSEHPIEALEVHLHRSDMLEDARPEVLERYAGFLEHRHRFLAIASEL